MCHCLQRNFFFLENAKIWVGRTTRNGEKKGMVSVYLRSDTTAKSRAHQVR